MAASPLQPILIALHDAERTIDKDIDNDQIHREASKTLRDIRHYVVAMFLEPSDASRALTQQIHHILGKGNLILMENCRLVLHYMFSVLHTTSELENAREVIVDKLTVLDDLSMKSLELAAYESFSDVLIYLRRSVNRAESSYLRSFASGLHSIINYYIHTFQDRDTEAIERTLAPHTVLAWCTMRVETNSQQLVLTQEDSLACVNCQLISTPCLLTFPEHQIIESPSQPNAISTINPTVLYNTHISSEQEIGASPAATDATSSNLASFDGDLLNSIERGTQEDVYTTSNQYQIFQLPNGNEPKAPGRKRLKPNGHVLFKPGSGQGASGNNWIGKIIGIYKDACYLQKLWQSHEVESIHPAGFIARPNEIFMTFGQSDRLVVSNEDIIADVPVRRGRMDTTSGFWWERAVLESRDLSGPFMQD